MDIDAGVVHVGREITRSCQGKSELSGEIMGHDFCARSVLHTSPGLTSPIRDTTSFDPNYDKCDGQKQPSRDWT